MPPRPADVAICGARSPALSKRFGGEREPGIECATSSSCRQHIASRRDETTAEHLPAARERQTGDLQTNLAVGCTHHVATELLEVSKASPPRTCQDGTVLRRLASARSNPCAWAPGKLRATPATGVAAGDGG